MKKKHVKAKPRSASTASPKPASAAAPSRWWVALVVVAAVVAIVVFKNSRDGATAIPLPPPDEPAATIALSAPAGPQPVTASPPRVVKDIPGDPYPSTAGEQVKWVERNKQPAMLLYHSTNCIPCKKMEELVAKVRGDYEPAVTFVDIITNDAANLQVVRQSGIQAIPTTFYVTREGQSKKVVGAVSEAALRAELDRLAGR